MQFDTTSEVCQPRLQGIKSAKPRGLGLLTLPLEVLQLLQIAFRFSSFWICALRFPDVGALQADGDVTLQSVL